MSYTGTCMQVSAHYSFYVASTRGVEISNYNSRANHIRQPNHPPYLWAYLSYYFFVAFYEVVVIKKIYIIYLYPSYSPTNPFKHVGQSLYIDIGFGVPGIHSIRLVKSIFQLYNIIHRL